MNVPQILVVPGLHGSGPSHWQSRWEARDPQLRRVLQRDWDAPELGAWVGTLQRHVAACAAPPVLVAHSLGCIAVAHLARRPGVRIRAALLVAPCDLDAPLGWPASLRSFQPLPLEALPFPSILVASTDDPYCGLVRARQLAHAWQSSLVVLPDAGHINVAAGFGPWAQGERLLAELIDATAPVALRTA